jgi:hypothetical protein
LLVACSLPYCYVCVMLCYNLINAFVVLFFFSGTGRHATLAPAVIIARHLSVVSGYLSVYIRSALYYVGIEVTLKRFLPSTVQPYSGSEFIKLNLDPPPNPVSDSSSFTKLQLSRTPALSHNLDLRQRPIHIHPISSITHRPPRQCLISRQTIRLPRRR